jgi:adenine-specific DNA methylase
MRFIEKTLPVEYLNPVAMAEGNSKKPVYQLHKWWARRLGSVFRAVTLATFMPADESEHSVWQKFCEGANLSGKVILDPFMGGGTALVEALRLGCKVIGVDINPVAWFVTKKEVEPVDLDALNAAFAYLEQTVGAQIRDYYRTTGPDEHPAEVMYFFWVKVASCERCGSRVKLFPNYELSRREDLNISVCPQCLQIVETVGYSPKTTCHDCGMVFDPRKGVAGRGAFRCSECGHEQKLLEAVRSKGGALDVELHGLEGYSETCGRFFKRVDDADLARWRAAQAEFERRKDYLLFPRQVIPIKGRSDPRPANHGYAYFWQMFNARQLLCLSMLLEAILKLPDTNIRELILAAFSDCLDANNMFCKYEIEWHKISLFFGFHAYHPIERPTENNVWGTELGRGTFTKCFEKVRKAKVYCQNPHERLLNLRGQRYSKRTGNERIEGYGVRSFDELIHTDRAALLKSQSSEDMSFIPSKSVDAVITDPPYFDNVQYSELADFFYVWLRLALKDTYEEFEPDYSHRPREIVKNEKLGKTTDFFNQGLQQVLMECHRVLKDEGLLVFTFHHNKTWAWESIAQLLMNTGFYVSASPIVRSEGKSGFHSSEGNIRYDAVLVCRKRPSPYEALSWVSLKQQILADAVKWTRRTLDSGMAINTVDVFAIVMAKTLEHFTKATPQTANGIKPITIVEAIREMSELIDRVAQTPEGDEPQVNRSYRKKCIQLSLALAESRERFNGKGSKRQRLHVEASE